MKVLKRTRRLLQGWMRPALLVLLFVVSLRLFFLDAYTIPTASMERTLLVGDFLLVNKAVFGAEVPGTPLRLPPLSEPVRGQVVVFRPPHDPDRSYVKRILGLPGDTLAMVEKVLHLNGRPLPEPYAVYLDRKGDAIHPSMTWQTDHMVAAHPHRPYAPTRDTWGPLVVPRGRYFVLGDNRDNSEDSRYWGFVDRKNIRGRPWIVYLSLRPDARGRGLLGRVRWDRVGRKVQ